MLFGGNKAVEQRQGALSGNPKVDQVMAEKEASLKASGLVEKGGVEHKAAVEAAKAAEGMATGDGAKKAATEELSTGDKALGGLAAGLEVAAQQENARKAAQPKAPAPHKGNVTTPDMKGMLSGNAFSGIGGL